MNGWITLKSVKKVPRIPEVAEVLYLTLRSSKGVRYKVFWQHSHVTFHLDENGYLEINLILTRPKDYFPTITQGGGKFDTMQITSTFLKESTLVEVFEVVCFIEDPIAVSDALKVFDTGECLEDTLRSHPEVVQSPDIPGLIPIEVYPTSVEISDEGTVYSYLYNGTEPIRLKQIQTMQVTV